jgi:hypothetical protein
VEGAVSLEQVTNEGTKFTNSFFDGIFTDTVDASGNPGAEALLKAMFTPADSALNADFSARADTVINTEAGAIVGDDLWYEGWVKSGTVE